MSATMNLTRVEKWMESIVDVIKNATCSPSLCGASKHPYLLDRFWIDSSNDEDLKSDEDFGDHKWLQLETNYPKMNENHETKQTDSMFYHKEKQLSVEAKKPVAARLMFLFCSMGICETSESEGNNKQRVGLYPCLQPDCNDRLYTESGLHDALDGLEEKGTRGPIQHSPEMVFYSLKQNKTSNPPEQKPLPLTNMMREPIMSCQEIKYRPRVELLDMNYDISFGSTSELKDLHKALVGPKEAIVFGNLVEKMAQEHTFADENNEVLKGQIKFHCALFVILEILRRPPYNALQTTAEWKLLYSNLMHFHGLADCSEPTEESHPSTTRRLFFPQSLPNLVHRTRLLLLATTPVRVAVKDGAKGLFAECFLLQGLKPLYQPLTTMKGGRQMSRSIPKLFETTPVTFVVLGDKESKRFDAKYVDTIRAQSLAARQGEGRAQKVTVSEALVRIVEELRQKPYVFNALVKVHDDDDSDGKAPSFRWQTKDPDFRKAHNIHYTYLKRCVFRFLKNAAEQEPGLETIKVGLHALLENRFGACRSCGTESTAGKPTEFTAVVKQYNTARAKDETKVLKLGNTFADPPDADNNGIFSTQALKDAATNARRTSTQAYYPVHDIEKWEEAKKDEMALQTLFLHNKNAGMNTNISAPTAAMADKGDDAATNKGEVARFKTVNFSVPGYPTFFFQLFTFFTNYIVDEESLLSILKFFINNGYHAHKLSPKSFCYNEAKPELTFLPSNGETAKPCEDFFRVNIIGVSVMFATILVPPPEEKKEKPLNKSNAVSPPGENKEKPAKKRNADESVFPAGSVNYRSFCYQFALPRIGSALLDAYAISGYRFPCHKEMEKDDTNCPELWKLLTDLEYKDCKDAFARNGGQGKEGKREATNITVIAALLVLLIERDKNKPCGYKASFDPKPSFEKAGEACVLKRQQQKGLSTLQPEFCYTTDEKRQLFQCQGLLELFCFFCMGCRTFEAARSGPALGSSGGNGHHLAPEDRKEIWADAERFLKNGNVASKDIASMFSKSKMVVDLASEQNRKSELEAAKTAAAKERMYNKMEKQIREQQGSETPNTTKTAAEDASHDGIGDDGDGANNKQLGHYDDGDHDNNNVMPFGDDDNDEEFTKSPATGATATAAARVTSKCNESARISDCKVNLFSSKTKNDANQPIQEAIPPKQLVRDLLEAAEVRLREYHTLLAYSEVIKDLDNQGALIPTADELREKLDFVLQDDNYGKELTDKILQFDLDVWGSNFKRCCGMSEGGVGELPSLDSIHRLLDKKNWENLPFAPRSGSEDSIEFNGPSAGVAHSVIDISNSPAAPSGKSSEHSPAAAEDSSEERMLADAGSSDYQPSIFGGGGGDDDVDYDYDDDVHVHVDDDDDDDAGPVSASASRKRTLRGGSHLFPDEDDDDDEDNQNKKQKQHGMDSRIPKKGEQEADSEKSGGGGEQQAIREKLNRRAGSSRAQHRDIDTGPKKSKPSPEMLKFFEENIARNAQQRKAALSRVTSV